MDWAAIREAASIIIMQRPELIAVHGEVRRHRHEHEGHLCVQLPRLAGEIDAQRSTDIIVEEKDFVFARRKATAKLLPRFVNVDLDRHIFLLRPVL